MPRYINPKNIKLNSLSWVDGGEDILVPLIDVRKAIAQTPSEDVVAVVRCKDCKYCEECHYEEEGEKPYIKLKCKWSNYSHHPNDFCSYGERKENESSID